MSEVTGVNLSCRVSVISSYYQPFNLLSSTLLSVVTASSPTPPRPHFLSLPVKSTIYFTAIPYSLKNLSYEKLVPHGPFLSLFNWILNGDLRWKQMLASILRSHFHLLPNHLKISYLKPSLHPPFPCYVLKLYNVTKQTWRSTFSHRSNAIQTSCLPKKRHCEEEASINRRSTQPRSQL
jgi:hypothetical protein